MAHFAQIDKDSVVVRVLATDNNDPNGDEGLQWLENTFGGTWIQTSYNAKIRGQYAGIGDTYDSKIDRFISAKPFDSWLLDKDFNWNAPKPMPTDGKNYRWNEEELNWIEITES